MQVDQQVPGRGQPVASQAGASSLPHTREPRAFQQVQTRLRTYGNTAQQRHRARGNAAWSRAAEQGSSFGYVPGPARPQASQTTVPKHMLCLDALCAGETPDHSGRGAGGASACASAGTPA